MTKTSTLEVRVYYEDTDAGGVVYYANYLRFAERARTEFLRGCGQDHNEMRAAHDIIFVVRHIVVDYVSPARLEDLLKIETRLTALGAASMTMHQIIRREEKVLVEMEVVLVSITPQGAVRRLPPKVRAFLEKQLSTDLA